MKDTIEIKELKLLVAVNIYLPVEVVSEETVHQYL